MYSSRDVTLIAFLTPYMKLAYWTNLVFVFDLPPFPVVLDWSQGTQSQLCPASQATITSIDCPITYVVMSRDDFQMSNDMDMMPLTLLKYQQIIEDMLENK